jgi:hypothetical protein
MYRTYTVQSNGQPAGQLGKKGQHGDWAVTVAVLPVIRAKKKSVSNLVIPQAASIKKKK